MSVIARAVAYVVLAALLLLASLAGLALMVVCTPWLGLSVALGGVGLRLVHESRGPRSP